MTREYHIRPAETDAYRRPSTVMAQSRSLAYHGSTRAYSDGRDEDCSPNDDSRPGRERKPRKRNSVACARCRKRKIKCTGDDGQGCEACQTAGTEKSTCYYLRVNSVQLPEVSSATDNEWPYTTSAPTAYGPTAPRITSDPSQYALTHGNMLPASTATPLLGQASSRGHSVHDMSNSLYPGAPARQSHPCNYYGNLENSPFPQYDMQSTRQAFPIHTSQAPTPGYPASDSSSSWVPLPTNSRSQYPSMTFDQDVTSSYAPPTFPYMATTGAPVNSGTSERSTTFPGLSPLVTHLPSHSTSRILPHPTSLHSAFDSNNGTAHEGDCDMGLFQQHLDKSSNSWEMNRLTTGTSRGSVSSALQDTICASGSTSSTSSSSASDTQDLPNFGYVPITQPSPMESIAGTSLNTDTYVANAASSVHYSRRRPGYIPILDRPSSIFGYSGGVNTSAIPLATNGSLTGSQPTQRILQPQPRHTPVYDVLRNPQETNPQPRGKVLKSNGNNHSSRGRR